MKFTDKEIEKLNKLANKKELLTIKGINCYGQEFETKGKIQILLQYPRVFNNQIQIEFSNDKDFYSVANFSTELEIFKKDFVILEISDSKGNQIYSNGDKNKIIKETRKNAIKKEFENTMYGTNITIYDPVLEKLKDLIGKPIILTSDLNYGNRIETESKKGIFYCIEESIQGYFAKIILKYYAISIFNESYYVKNNTRLETILEDGTKVLLADNRECDFNAISKERNEYYERTQQELQNIKEKERQEEDNKDNSNSDDWWVEK